MQQAYKIAAIDVGTNSVRLLVCEISSEGELIPLYKHIMTTRIGEGLSATGQLGEEAIDRTIEAIEELKEKAVEMGAQRVMCYATAAVREAGNRDYFIRKTHRKTQLLVDVLPGEVEAQVSFAGVPGSGARCTVDIGGGSTDVVLGFDDVPLVSASLRLGAVRAAERYPRGDVADPLTLTAMQQWAGNVMKNDLKDLMESAGSLSQITYYGVGGTCTTLAAMDQRLAEYDPEKVHGYTLTRRRVGEMLEQLCSLTLEQRKALPGLSPKRADIIIGGTVILAAFMDKMQAEAIRVSERDNLEGYILMRLKKEQG